MKMLFYTISVSLLLVACNFSKPVKNVEPLGFEPTISPDYLGVTIPATIAPLNFALIDSFEKVDILISGSNEGKIHLQGTKVPDIPIRLWQSLLKKNIGKSLEISVHIFRDQKWFGYEPFYWFVSPDNIDESICYRLIAPGYEVYSKMGIYQRTLSDFTQDVIYENSLVPGSCVNCHSFKETDQSYFTMHIRGKHGGTFVSTPEHPLTAYSTKTDSTISACVYPYWHSSGMYIAYSNNETRQTFHTREFERIEVFDFKSDITVYDIANNKLISSPLLRTDNYETFPAFSTDGKRLFFCNAEQKKMPKEFKEVKYNLCSIDFDPETQTFGNHIDTLLRADHIGKSITFPRPSYDGRFLMFVAIDYGQFSIWHKEADLWMLDLKDGSILKLDEINSNDTESCHSWSSNSRWVVFSSRRGDGLYTRPYIAHIDENGKASKAFLLPQKDPVTFYDQLIYSYNIPEFCNGRLTLDNALVEDQLLEEKKPEFTFSTQK